MGALRVWADKDKIEKIKRLPKVFVMHDGDETQGDLVIYNTPETKQRIMHILNDEE